MNNLNKRYLAEVSVRFNHKHDLFVFEIFYQKQTLPHYNQ